MAMHIVGESSKLNNCTFYRNELLYSHKQCHVKQCVNNNKHLGNELLVAYNSPTKQLYIRVRLMHG